MTRYASIEALRGAAALLVLLAHVKFPVIDACGADALPDVLRGGWGACGVDLFFVISGFVIGLTLDRPGVTWRSFLAARLARVVPVYFLFTAVCLAIPAVVCVPVDPERRGRLVRLSAPVRCPPVRRDDSPVRVDAVVRDLVLPGRDGRRRDCRPAGGPVCLATVFLAGPLALSAAGYDGPWYFPGSPSRP